jgi:thiazole synthase
MPAGSPIGSGQGVLNRNNIVLCLELLKQGDPGYPVIVDAGVGSASDVSLAMELGADGVLLNTAIAHAMRAKRAQSDDGPRDAQGVRPRAAELPDVIGRIAKKLYATASSPMEGAISYIPGE